VIHRDIKPSTKPPEGGHAMVADFGIPRCECADGDTRCTKRGGVDVPQRGQCNCDAHHRFAWKCKRRTT